MRRSRIVALVVAIGLGLGLTACTTDAEVANKNISQDADNFKVLRRIIFFNGITDKVIMTIEGYCSLDTGDPKNLKVTCKVDNGGFKRSYLGLSDNVTWYAEQPTPQNVSTQHYKVTFKPELIVPDIEIR